MLKKNRHSMIPRLSLGLTLVSLVSGLVGADLSRLSLDELSQIPVVESSKQKEKLFDAPASAFIFGEEALAYLPVDSVPELLRYAPGVNVLRSSNGAWGVGVRGMNLRYFGRSVFAVEEQNLYAGVFAGIFGSQHDLVFDDISSIEVVYGSGGSLWSSNAVNGMINVVMKSAFETEGSVLRTQLGSHHRNVSVRHGWALSERTSARVYLKYGVREEGNSPLFDDRWETGRAGLQVDSRLTARDLLTFSGEAHFSLLGEARWRGVPETGEIVLLRGDEEQRGANCQLKWTHRGDGDVGFSVRGWAGTSTFESTFVKFGLSAAGFEYQGRQILHEHHEFNLVLSTTLTEFDFEEGARGARFTEGAERLGVQAAGSLQYSWKMIPDLLELSSGVRVQYDRTNEKTEILPSARAVWHLTEDSRLWVSYSRTSRTPPRGITDSSAIEFRASPIPPFDVPTPAGVFTVDRQFTYAAGGGYVDNETKDSFELGYRQQIGDRAVVRINTFYDLYSDLMGIKLTPEAAELMLFVAHPYVRNRADVVNAAEGTSWGGEISWEQKLTEATSFTLTYAYLEEKWESYRRFTEPGQQLAVETLGISPSHLASLWLARRWIDEFRTDLGLRYAGPYENAFGRQGEILQMDIRATWEPSERWRFSLVGRNLLDPELNGEVHRDVLTLPSRTGAEWYLEMRLEF
jgi:iron complex outermembrane receptor protein